MVRGGSWLLSGTDALLTCMQEHLLAQHRLSLFTERGAICLLFQSPSSGQNESCACHVRKDEGYFCNAPVPPAVTFFLSVTTPLQCPYLF